MPLFVLDTNELTFPPTYLAEPDGLLAIGGDLSPARLLLAYQNGIFPWYEGEDILWWCPDPRFVLFPGELKINKTIKKLLKDDLAGGSGFEFTVNKAFKDVIQQCKKITRKDQDGTWITDDVQKAYTTMHELGYAHSAEVWQNDELIGGLYGIRLGKVFFGESMFSKVSNASRYAFIRFLQSNPDIGLVDCQVYTAYLESLGARMIKGKEFDELLKALIP